MKILFIDHSFHQRTKSSNFFYNLVSAWHAVETCYIEPGDRNAHSLLSAADNFDLVILWQLDFLAPILLARGIPTVVVPMYDGSSLMPDLHWIWLRSASLVNFSRRLHDRVSQLGCSSYLCKYFLPPVEFNKRAKFDDGFKVLLWQRRPEEGINLQLVERLFGSSLLSVHIHDAPDDRSLDTSEYLKQASPSYKLTTSRWFDTGSEFHQLLSGCNVLVAPRRSEGIGMTMLEGLSRGMLVLAYDAPTHDEYIANWTNGVLFNPSHADTTDFSTAAKLGEMAWITASEGYAKWISSEPNLLEFVERTNTPRTVDVFRTNAIAEKLIRAYLAGLDEYQTFLINHVAYIEEQLGTDLRGKIDRAGTYHPDGVEPPIQSASAGYHWLDQNRLSFREIGQQKCVSEGKALQGEHCAWIVGHSIKFSFRLDPELGVTDVLRIEYRLLPSSPAPMGYCVLLNSITLGIGVLEADGHVDLSVPPYAIGRDNTLLIVLERTAIALNAGEPLSVGLQSVSFS